MLLGKNAPSILGQLTGATQIKSIASILLLISLRWKRVGKNGAFYSLLSGSLTAIIWHIAGNPYGVQPLWPALLLSMAVLLAFTLPAGKACSKEYENYQEIMKTYEALPADRQ